MDVVTRSLLKEFVASQKLEGQPSWSQFESFINYIVVADNFSEEFDLSLISTGPGEFGIDGVGILVNDLVVEDEEQVHDIIEQYPSLQVQFIFTQAKSCETFDTGELSKFFAAVLDFFSESPRFQQSQRITELKGVQKLLYEQSPKFTRGLPKLSLFYASTGTWTDDANLRAVCDVFLLQFHALHMFSTEKFYPLDAAKIQKLYFQTKNAFNLTIQFSQNISLPDIPNVRESYIGILSAKEYLRIVTDEEGNIRRKLFFDNIRDFQGDTSVNRSIAETLSSDRGIEFPLRNNGVTIVARKLQRVGSSFTLEDFQIVNGCQTSHVIAQSAINVDATIMIPVKIIATEDEEITRNVIIASNQQNKVDQGTFWALEPIHKSIEIYFESKDGDQRLYYERRPGQFNTITGIEKVRIITKDLLLKVYASVFLEQPNQVGRYYKDLTPLIGKEIFAPNHPVHPYYTAAYIAYRLEFMFRNRRLGPEWKPFRFQLAMALRLILEKSLNLDTRKKHSKQYCDKIDTIVLDIEKAHQIFNIGTELINKAIGKLQVPEAALNRRTAKMRDMRDGLRTVIAKNPNLSSMVQEILQ